MTPGTIVPFEMRLRDDYKPPGGLGDLPLWLLWRLRRGDDGKSRKMPYYASGDVRQGALGGPADRSGLVTFMVAVDAARRGGYNGVGLAMLGDEEVTAIDLDHCVNERGEIVQEVLEAISNTYAEISPSGKGVRVLVRGRLADGKPTGVGGGYKVEVFHKGQGFVTITGRVVDGCRLAGLDDVVAPPSDGLLGILAAHGWRDTAGGGVSGGAELLLGEETVVEALLYLQGGDYDSWMRVGFMVKRASGGAAWGLRVFQAWSETQPGYVSKADVSKKWAQLGDRAGGGSELTGRSLIAAANAAGARIEMPDAVAGVGEFDDLGVDEEPGKKKRVGPKLEHFREVLSAPPMRWFIQDVVPWGDDAFLLWGASGSGKTFVAIDFAFHIARGLDWRGRKTRQGKVVYLCAEGRQGIPERLRAYRQHHAIPDDEEIPLWVVRYKPDLTIESQQKELRDAILAQVGRIDLLITDTLAQVGQGKEDNEEFNRILRGCEVIRIGTGAMPMIIHHPGKDISKGPRGGYTLHGAVDAEVQVVRDGDRRYLDLSKMRDASDDLKVAFALLQVETGVDAEGQAVTSMVAVEDEMVHRDEPKLAGEHMKRLYRYIVSQLDGGADSVPEIEAIDATLALTPPPDPGKEDRRREVIKRAATLLRGTDKVGLILRDGAWKWPA